MKIIGFLLCFMYAINASDISLQKSLESKENYATSPLFLQNLDSKTKPMTFKFYEPWYFLPAYISFSPTYDDKTLLRQEMKAQISSRLEFLDGVVCTFCSFSFDLNLRLYLQSYNASSSSPLRDFDLSPGLSFIYKKPLAIKNGEYGYITWLGLGYLHISNGEREDIKSDIRQGTSQWAINKNNVRSKSLDREFVEINYRYKHFNARLRAWIYPVIVAFDGKYTNGDIADYIGYGDIKFSYTLGQNLFEIYINNIFNNYFEPSYWQNWRGQVELGYTLAISKQVALYVQYLIGHGDSLYEYSLPVNRIGVGFRLKEF